MARASVLSAFLAAVVLSRGACALSFDSQERRDNDDSNAATFASYSLGEVVQVKLDASGWVDCHITRPGGAPNTYDVHVAGGEEENVTAQDLPAIHASKLRRVHKGMEVNLPGRGEAGSDWVACVVTGPGKVPGSVNVELTEDMPGYVLPDVPGKLLRNSHERLSAAEKVQGMIKLNEARKKELFSWNEHAVEEMAKKKLQEEQFKKEVAEGKAKEEQKKEMMQKAWAEMAKRAERENEAREGIMSYIDKKKAKETAAKDKSKKQAKERRERWEEEAAETNPIIALKLEAQKIEQRVRADAAEDAANKKKLEDEERAYWDKRQQEKLQKEQQEVDAVMEKMNKLREMHEAVIHSPTALPPEIAAIGQESLKAFEEVEAGKTHKREIGEEEMQKITEAEQQKWKEDEAARQEAGRLKMKNTASRTLVGLADQFEATKNQGKVLPASWRQQMRTALKEAEDLSVETEELDAARLVLVRSLSDAAREAVEKADKVNTAKEIQDAINTAETKSREIERVWVLIADESKSDAPSRFLPAELDSLRRSLPETQKSEAKVTVARLRLDEARKTRKSYKMQQAIKRAEEAGLQSDEIQKAKDNIEEWDSFGKAKGAITQAISNHDQDQLEAAINIAEKAQYPAWKVKEMRHLLKAWKENTKYYGPPTRWLVS